MPFWKTCWRGDWPVGEVDDLQPGAHGLHRALHGHDAPGALGRHVQVVRDGAGRHLQHLKKKKTFIISLFKVFFCSQTVEAKQDGTGTVSKAVFRIRIQWFGSGFIDSGPGASLLDWIPIQGYDEQKMKKIYNRKKKIFFWSKLLLTYPWALIKDAQATLRSLEPSKENIQHFKTWSF